MLNYPYSMFRLRNSLLLIALTLTVFSCKKKEEPKPADNYTGPTYFSIKEFTRDQWKTFHGQPVVLMQYITRDGKTDSTAMSALTMKWSSVFEAFFETDISDPKFLEKYDFSDFQEDVTQTRMFTYVAKDPSLFTQKLEISVDMFTNKIRNIYIETRKESFWNTQTKKLLYSPMRALQIQEHNDPLIGSQEDEVLSYKFM